MLARGQTGRGVYGNSLNYLPKFPVNLKLSKMKNWIKSIKQTKFLSHIIIWAWEVQGWQKVFSVSETQAPSTGQTWSSPTWSKAQPLHPVPAPPLLHSILSTAEVTAHPPGTPYPPLPLRYSQHILNSPLPLLYTHILHSGWKGEEEDKRIPSLGTLGNCTYCSQGEPSCEEAWEM